MPAATSRQDLERDQWKDFFERATKEHQGQDATIEVLTSEYGDQVEAEKLPFAYIEYDHRGDMVIVGVGGRDGRYPVVLDYTVREPQAVLVTNRDPALVDAVEVVGADRSQSIVTWHRHPALPPR